MASLIPPSQPIGTRVLVVDDDPDMLPLIALGLGAIGCEVRVCADADAALGVLAREPIDVVVTDVLMAGVSGLDLCARVAAGYADLPVIVMTAQAKLETAVAAIRVGAYDFITKPLHLDALGFAVARAAAHRSLRGEVAQLRRTVETATAFDELLGASERMRALFPLLRQIAASDASVLVSGESGTGKEVVARVLHRNGRRRSGPLVAVNCAAIPAPLLESELFGHARGAFTDARAARDGLFVQAHGGTLFLDEIGELPLALQPKLLRALEERVVRPVGGGQEIPFDARVIVATNRDLEAAVEARTFREDLYYRINVLAVTLPPLRARGRDVLLLAQHFGDRFAAEAGQPARPLAPAAAERLLAYAWPGNVRELRNCMERVVALAQGDVIGAADLPEKIREHHAAELALPLGPPEDLLSMGAVEQRYILRVLELLGGNKRRAAQVLGFDRRTLYRKLAKYGVTTDRDETG